MRRFALWSALVAAMSLASEAAIAQDRKSVFMVLWRGETRVEEGFRAYVAEKNLALDLEIVSLERDLSNLPSTLEKIREADPDLVYTWGTSTTLGIAGRDPNLASGPDDFPPQVLDKPIVFTMVSQPVRSRIVPELGPSGRNVTGVSHIIPMETQLQAMQAYMPVDRVAVIYTDTEPNSVLAVEQLLDVGQEIGIKVDAYPVPLDSTGAPDPLVLPQMVQDAAAAGPQFLYMGPDSFIGQYAKIVTDAANELQLATFASTERTLASSDSLYGLVAPYTEVGRLTAQKVEAVLFEGKDPSEVPVDTLQRFSYQVRIDVAREIGVYPAMSLMDYAEIIDWGQ
ncbi:MAG: ABC transporter substrate-binding protein [Pseudomonadota bacterium]